MGVPAEGWRCPTLWSSARDFPANFCFIANPLLLFDKISHSLARFSVSYIWRSHKNKIGYLELFKCFAALESLRGYSFFTYGLHFNIALN